MHGVAPPMRNEPFWLLWLLGDEPNVAALLLFALQFDTPEHQVVQIDGVLLTQLLLLPASVVFVQVPRFVPARQRTVGVCPSLNLISEQGVHLFQRDGSVLRGTEGRFLSYNTSSHEFNMFDEPSNASLREAALILCMLATGSRYKYKSDLTSVVIAVTMLLCLRNTARDNCTEALLCSGNRGIVSIF